MSKINKKSGGGKRLFVFIFQRQQEAKAKKETDREDCPNCPTKDEPSVARSTS